MTKHQTTAGKRARALADEAGRRYADALRAVRAGAAGLTVGMLVLEAATRPVHEEPCQPGCRGWEYDEGCDACQGGCAPARFLSQLLGGVPVPYDSVLALAAELGGEPGRAVLGDPVVVEGPWPGAALRVRVGERRFNLGLHQGGVRELCRNTGCDGPSWYWWGYCERHLHLRWLTVDQAVDAVRDWAFGVFEDSGTREHDERTIIRAALLAGADDEEVVRTLAEGANRDAEGLEGMGCDDEAEEARQAIRRDRDRLEPVVRAERHALGERLRTARLPRRADLPMAASTSPF